jgi:DNA-binding transcriptional MocR family regulator
VIDAVVERRAIGPAWSSRILQGVLAALLEDPLAVATVARAREAYSVRRHALVCALAEHGVEVGGSDGINLWVPTDDERTSTVSLAARSIGVAPGFPFESAPLPSEHIRVTVSMVREDVHAVAAALAEAVRGRRSSGRHQSR